MDRQRSAVTPIFAIVCMAVTVIWLRVLWQVIDWIMK